jgi:hypothetical protein
MLDEPIPEKSGAWAEFNEIVAGMSEKPRFEDFPRCQLGRESVAFGKESTHEIS